jgi:energy-coupling factor transport system ATP-binding protein
MTSTLFSLRNAVVSYDSASRPALGGVDVDVERGSWTAVCGANGSGKSTLLAVLAGLTPLTRGEVDRGDVRIAVLLQDPDNQFVATSVRHELAMSVPADRDRGERERRIAEAVDRFALASVLDRNPHRLSGGEKQRLALATVWLEAPDVMLLDEPLAFLDAESRDLVIAFVREMNARGVTVVWATPGEDAVLARDAVVLEAGAVAYAGPATGWAPETRPRRARAATGGAGPPILSMRRVSFSYGRVPVFRGLDLSVRAGECVGVFGRNSAGKSTLLLLAGGALAPEAGNVARNDASAPVLYLPQSPERLFFAETVRDEIEFGIRRRGLPRDDMIRRTAESLRGVGLDPETFADRSPFRLSYGEMRRVAFAVAEALAPALLLLDEPASCLDADGQAAVVDLIERRVRAGGAVIVASHDRAQLEASCDRIVTLEGARPEKPQRNAPESTIDGR